MKKFSPVLEYTVEPLYSGHPWDSIKIKNVLIKGGVLISGDLLLIKGDVLISGGPYTFGGVPLNYEGYM